MPALRLRLKKRKSASLPQGIVFGKLSVSQYRKGQIEDPRNRKSFFKLKKKQTKFGPFWENSNFSRKQLHCTGNIPQNHFSSKERCQNMKRRALPIGLAICRVFCRICMVTSTGLKRKRSYSALNFNFSFLGSFYELHCVTFMFFIDDDSTVEIISGKTFRRVTLGYGATLEVIL